MTVERAFDIYRAVPQCDCAICQRFNRSFGGMQSVLNPHPLPPKPKKETK